MKQSYTAHVVSHTHWDREWYMPFQHYRMRLVELTDMLLDLLERSPDFKYWTFDGQTVVLEDYLAIRPENRERLVRLISEGRILIGPWYDQPDEFLVSGENLIRNLLLGKKMCDEFGGRMTVGYVPDEFGHISQLPQILLGFGVDSAVFFRGITQDQVDAEFLWKGADGSEVLAVKLPDNNAYSNWFYRLRETLRYPDKAVDPEQVTADVKALVDDCISERPTTDQLLFMDGCDHVFPQFKTPEIIAIANERLDNVTIIHSTLPAFIQALRSAGPKLAAYSGELRWSNRDWKLQGLLANTLSSRIHLKQANHACEILLEKYVEPLASWAWVLGEDYPKSYIDLCWNYLLKNSPHDSICGCSVDQVHKDMVYRYDQVKLIGERLLGKSLKAIADRIGSQSDDSEKSVLLAVFNTLAVPRTDVLEAEVDLPGDWAIPGLRITDPDGHEVPYALVGVEHYHTMDPTPYDIPLGEHRQKARVVFLASDVPALGYKAYRVEVLDKPNRAQPNMLLGPDTAENEYISLTVMSDGTFSLLDKETDAVFTSCLIFEDGGDVGDGYNYVKPLCDKVVTSLGAKCSVSIAENNPVRVVFQIDTELLLPCAIEPDRMSRSSETVACPVRTFVTVAAGVKRVDIKTIFDNNARDHRLRVLFPTGLPARFSHAESAFDVVQRQIATLDCSDWREPMPRTHPQKSFVDLSGDGVGFTLINKGLPEYEAVDDEARTIALTLLRATGSGVCGPKFQVEGQMIGRHTFEYSIYPHAGNWYEGASYEEAHRFNVPLIVGQTGIHDGALPLTASLLHIDGEGFVLSALKKAENSEALVMRGFNIGHAESAVTVAADFATFAELADLKEDTISTLDIGSEGCIALKIKPKQIITCKLCFRR